MPELPASCYLRRSAIRDYLGIDDTEFTQLVKAGVLTPFYFQGRGRAWFRRADVVAAEAANLIFKSTQTAATP